MQSNTHTHTHTHTQASERRSLKTKTEEIRKELRLANKAVIEVSLDLTLVIIFVPLLRKYSVCYVVHDFYATYILSMHGLS